MMEKEKYYQEWYSKMKADPERWKAYKAARQRWWSLIYSLPERKAHIAEIRRASYKRWLEKIRSDPDAYLQFLKKRRDAAKRRRQNK